VGNSTNTAEERTKKKNTSLNIKFLLVGLIAGAILSPIILLSTGQTTTTENANRMVRESANATEALVIAPYCVANFNASPNAASNIAVLQKTNHWERAEFIMEGGWANAPDGSGRGSLVANACADKLLADASTAGKS
jgi:hypothetical protein